MKTRLRKNKNKLLIHDKHGNTTNVTIVLSSWRTYSSTEVVRVLLLLLFLRSFGIVAFRSRNRWKCGRRRHHFRFSTTCAVCFSRRFRNWAFVRIREIKAVIQTIIFIMYLSENFFFFYVYYSYDFLFFKFSYTL